MNAHLQCLFHRCAELMLLSGKSCNKSNEVGIEFIYKKLSIFCATIINAENQSVKSTKSNCLVPWYLS